MLTFVYCQQEEGGGGKKSYCSINAIIFDYLIS